MTIFTHPIASAVTPHVVTPLQKRNTLADWTFYDVSNLNNAEFNWLASQPIKEGTILVVEPEGDPGKVNIRKHENHTVMVAHPGEFIQHFAIAGVGSSDVGAASLARTMANFLNKPVGAIVAGYGVADLLQEALGGWFFFGAANRAQAVLDEFNSLLSARKKQELLAEERKRAVTVAASSNDTKTLLKLLKDEGRDIQTLLGHSKGCLSVAFALNKIKKQGGSKALAPYKNTEVITAGAVVELPEEIVEVRQYLGEIDWFGGINSIPGIDYIKVPNAWHHLNTELPLAMDLSNVLEGRFDPFN